MREERSFRAGTSRWLHLRVATRGATRAKRSGGFLSTDRSITLPAKFRRERRRFFTVTLAVTLRSSAEGIDQSNFHGLPSANLISRPTAISCANTRIIIKFHPRPFYAMYAIFIEPLLPSNHRFRADRSVCTGRLYVAGRRRGSVLLFIWFRQDSEIRRGKSSVRAMGVFPVASRMHTSKSVIGQFRCL